MTHLLVIIIYLAFVGLGLPDSLLGAAWPSMYAALGLPLSFAGILSLVISLITMVSTLFCSRMTARFGTGKVTAFSTALTALALLGYSFSVRPWQLFLWSLPYGLGAGCIDAALNNYVSLHYSSRHMSWLHCMWGLGASVGPYVIGSALASGSWQLGYRRVFLIQIGIAAVLLLSLPLWKEQRSETEKEEKSALSLAETVRLPGVKAGIAAFFCYCAVEQTAGLWAASFLVLRKGISEETAAGLAGMFFIGITLGRALNGFVANRYGDHTMVRFGEAVIALGIALLFLPLPEQVTFSAFLIIGLGCAPIFPSLIHASPAHFGEKHSPAAIGVQMSSAYAGTCAVPALFGVLAKRTGIGILPWFLLLFFIPMLLATEKLKTVKE